MDAINKTRAHRLRRPVLTQPASIPVHLYANKHMAKNTKDVTADQNTPAATVEAPAPIVTAPKAFTKAIGQLATAEKTTAKSYKAVAKEGYEWGAKNASLKDAEIRITVAKSLAEGFSVDLDLVTLSPKKVKEAAEKGTYTDKQVSMNTTLNSLCSTLVGIIRPRSDEAKAALAEILETGDDEIPTWSAIVKASRAGGKKREGKPTDGTEDTKAVFTISKFAEAVSGKVALAATATLAADEVWTVGVMTLIESIKRDYPKSQVKFEIPKIGQSA